MKRRNFLTAGALTLGSATFARANHITKTSGAVDEQYPIGDFILQRTGINQLRVVHKQLPNQVLWQSAADGNFLIAEKATANIKEFGEPVGSFSIIDTVLATYDQPSIDQITVVANKLIVSGKLAAQTGSIGYTISLNQVAPAQLQFEIKTDNLAKGVNRIRIRMASSADEAFFGFGQQLTFFNQKTKRLPILVQEHGVGRGLPIITDIVDFVGHGGGGQNPYTTEAPAPHFISSKLQSLCLENKEYSEFDMQAAAFTDIKLWSGVMTGRILFGATPLDLIETYTAYCGRMRALPDWVHQGAIVCVQGGTDTLYKRLDQLNENHTPLAGIWFQDWCGGRITPSGSQLWWNWILDEREYHDWEKVKKDMKDMGARILTYMNPFLGVEPDKENPDYSPPRNSLYLYAKEQGFLVKDKNGEPYLIKNTTFDAAMVDLSNPQAREWLKREYIQKEMIDHVGASGWMTDFGEALPFDSQLSGNADPAVWHNHYTEQWAQLHREAITEVDRENDILFFNRSGFTHSPGYSTLFWLGDQLESWDQYDGIKTAVVGMLSGGVSGFSLVHSDIGGYVSLKLQPDLKRFPKVECEIPIIYRSDELLQRWMELAAFTCVFRTHEGLDPTVAAQFQDTPENKAHLARFANVYKGLATYRKQVVAEATGKGYPVTRHLFLHYPNDPNTYALRYQYLLGRDLLVAPVLDKGATTVEVYFPVGDEWVDLWSGADAGKPGQWSQMPAPLGKPPVFLRKGAATANAIVSGLKAVGVL